MVASCRYLGKDEGIFFIKEVIFSFDEQNAAFISRIRAFFYSINQDFIHRIRCKYGTIKG